MTFDFAIVGAGLSGLMLASRLVGVDAASSAIDGGPRVLLVAPAMHHHRGTAFAFWITRGTPLDRVLDAVWLHALTRDLARVVRALPPGPFVTSAARLPVG